MDRKFRRIDKDSVSELFDANISMSTTEVVKSQSMRVLGAWL